MLHSNSSVPDWQNPKDCGSHHWKLRYIIGKWTHEKKGCIPSAHIREQSHPSLLHLPQVPCYEIDNEYGSLRPRTVLSDIPSGNLSYIQFPGSESGLCWQRKNCLRMSVLPAPEATVLPPGAKYMADRIRIYPWLSA